MFTNSNLTKVWHRVLQPRAMNAAWLILTIAVVLSVVGCAKPTATRFHCDDERIDQASVIPEQFARDTIRKHADEAWVENPYLTSTVTVERKHPDFGYVKEIQKEEQRIEYNEMIMYPDYAGRCILISISQMEGYKAPSHQPFLKGGDHYFLTPRGFCPRTKAEMDELIDAFLRLGADCKYAR